MSSGAACFVCSRGFSSRAPRVHVGYGVGLHDACLPEFERLAAGGSARVQTVQSAPQSAAAQSRVQSATVRSANLYAGLPRWW